MTASRGIFTDNEITAFACLTFGFLDSDAGLSDAFVTALDHLDEMGFVRKQVRPNLTTWTLREVPPMAQAAVRERVAYLDAAAKQGQEERS